MHADNTGEKSHQGVESTDDRDTLSIRSARQAKTYDTVDDAVSAFVNAEQISHMDFVSLGETYAKNGMPKEAEFALQLGGEVEGTMDGGAQGLFIGAKQLFDFNQYCQSDEIKPLSHVMDVVVRRLSKEADRLRDEERLDLKMNGKFLDEVSRFLGASVSTWKLWREGVNDLRAEALRRGL